VGPGAPGSQWQGSRHEVHKLCQGRLVRCSIASAGTPAHRQAQPGGGAAPRAMHQVSVRSAVVHFVTAGHAPAPRLII